MSHAPLYYTFRSLVVSADYWRRRRYALLCMLVDTMPLFAGMLSLFSISSFIVIRYSAASHIDIRQSRATVAGRC